MGETYKSPWHIEVSILDISVWDINSTAHVYSACTCNLRLQYSQYKRFQICSINLSNNLYAVAEIIFEFKCMVIYFSSCWEIHAEWADPGSSENSEDLEGTQL